MFFIKNFDIIYIVKRKRAKKMNEDKDDELTPEELEELNNIFGLEGEAALTNEDIKEMTNAFDSLFTSIASAFMAESIKQNLK